ncbi:VOC family protein [Paraburkholderia sp. Ac-20340]|uniref:VOC family protein n=1 Tax=Paraburkholderia sp. Ac-20340 TaxID=2703888 RepID=UPI00197DFD28|nr:VOC family protein [Paraburkholderia sp. Ac-20340]MBN3854888.1 VOC family protein [Paraburkholderia sp. Ac-20340]
MNQPIHSSLLTRPVLRGVHHTARPTWKLEETVHFYRDLLGLPLVHAISARGWGPADHADFLHFFFDSGNGSTIAFFYYIGTVRPEQLAPSDHYQVRATHTAWQVNDAVELAAWRTRVEQAGIDLRYQVRHEVIESIYFNDPNGYPIEITYQTRPFDAMDAADATRTIEAAIEMEQRGERGEPFASIDPVWQRKASRMQASADTSVASVFVLDVPEFRPLIDSARESGAYATTAIDNGYIRIDGNPGITFKRKALGFKPAVWYGALTGGLAGHIEQFDTDSLVISPVVQS